MRKECASLVELLDLRQGSITATLDGGFPELRDTGTWGKQGQQGQQTLAWPNNGEGGGGQWLWQFTGVAYSGFS